MRKQRIFIQILLVLLTTSMVACSKKTAEGSAGSTFEARTTEGSEDICLTGCDQGTQDEFTSFPEQTPMMGELVSEDIEVANVQAFSEMELLVFEFELEKQSQKIEVYSPVDGQVMAVKNLKEQGKLVEIQYGESHLIKLHFVKDVQFEAGEMVARGQYIGRAYSKSKKAKLGLEVIKLEDQTSHCPYLFIEGAESENMNNFCQIKSK